MKLVIDTNEKTLSLEDGHDKHTMPLYSKAAFELISHQWIKVGWDQKYAYTFSWLGRPIIQLPEDLIRIQEVIYETRPDVIIETGVAHGGSLIYYATLCKAIGKGRVIGIDIEIRPHNRAAIQGHDLATFITLIEGDSTAPATISRVKGMLSPTDKVLVILDSNHSKTHVRRELDAYHALVTPGSYLVATDGVMNVLYDVPRGHADWRSDNPVAAAQEFATVHSEFVQSQPAWPFNESSLTANITHWPGAWLKRVR